MSNRSKPIPDEEVMKMLFNDIVPHSLLIGEYVSSVQIYWTASKPLCTYVNHFEHWEDAVACARYLVRMGAPIFEDSDKINAYHSALEDQLRQGVLPSAAREEALRMVNTQEVD